LIGAAFAALATYLLVQSTVVLASGYRPRHSVPGIIWTALTAAVMFALALSTSSLPNIYGPRCPSSVPELVRRSAIYVPV
jgi:hypothetical protein